MTSHERAHQRQLRRSARRAFEPAVLRWFCEADELDFARYGTLHDLGNRPRPRWTGFGSDGRSTLHYVDEHRFYIHQDNGSNVLGVAHLDTVQARKFCHVYKSKSGIIAASPALDDRLGAYVICHLLPALGLRVDWLLTTGEEDCDSTAGDFEAPKSYDWMFQFDRCGTDVVMYDYDTPENRERLAEVGAPAGIGSYSDIGSLEHLGIAGFNWGVGYHNAHESSAFALLDETFLNVGRFLSFHEKHAGERIEHLTRPKWWEELEEDLESGECPSCGAVLVDEFCENCAVDWTDISYRRQRQTLDLSDAEWRRLQEESA